MCCSPESYVQARVVKRLVEAGVSRQKAEGIGRKVAKAYAAKRQPRTS